MYQSYIQYLSILQSSDKYRRLGLPRQAAPSDFLDFSTNDYLGLSRNKQVLQAAELVCQNYGVGATGSRLLSGNFDLYEEFEETIALDKKSESSLIFNSGFQANISVLSSLLDDKVLKSKPLVFFDKLNHSSLYQALSLSSAEVYRYRHNDMTHLETLLTKHKNSYRPKFIVTETVFGMDGDIVSLNCLIKLATEYKAFVYLDEAHATGVFGINGYGVSTQIELQHMPYIVMGTFSKAIGASGGYIACHQVIRDYLINKANGFIYSTASSPMVMGAAFKAWKMLKNLEKERLYLQNLGHTLRAMLVEKGFNIGMSRTHIVPIILKEEQKCLKAKDLLLEKGIHVSCIRPPTVPLGTARLRVALTIHHQLNDLERLVQALERVA